MHLLAAQPGMVSDGSEAVDLGQTAGDLVVLTAADTEIAALAAAHEKRRRIDPKTPSLRLANLMQLSHNMSVDLYIDTVLSKAKLIIVRLLGGKTYWPYGVDQISAMCRQHNIPIAWLPGDDQPDTELSALSTVSADGGHRLWQYCVHGGTDNAESFLNFAASIIGYDSAWREPKPLLQAGLYWPDAHPTSAASLPWKKDRPVAAIVFYRALVQAANVSVIDALINALQNEDINPLPVFVTSLKDPIAAELTKSILAQSEPDVILNGTAFAVSTPNANRAAGPFDDTGCPVFQIVFSGGNMETWRSQTNGLSARDIAMNVALPEVDGRILTRAVSFKGSAKRNQNVQADIVTYEPAADRINFVAKLASNWIRLRRKQPQTRKVALILANYPNRDGRMGNGVGLDTPASAANVLDALTGAGYYIENKPADGQVLIERLALGPTNAGWKDRAVEETLSFADYQLFFASLPITVQRDVIDRWGPPETDPFFQPGNVDCGHFAIPAYRCGHAAVALQPARGYNIDPVASYHDPALIPPHNYFAFYAWIRDAFRADAVIHLGKHGNMEWLPGKALALSNTCYPELALGPTPHFYPFIVNDPGEGTQAKRRSQAVIIDHLTPPLTRAESYGPLKDLEQLVDEYFEAASIDPRRLKLLSRQILELAQSIGLDQDCGIAADATESDALSALDNYLCELKEMQIRDGLHIFGAAPVGELQTNLLVALARVPRNKDSGGESLIRAIANDLNLGFDPLDCTAGDPWTGPKPEILKMESSWRTCGDTIERIELFAAQLVGGGTACPREWSATQKILQTINNVLQPAVESCGHAEIAGLLRGLDGRFVPPGPSGAPTRGRPDVLPTGRNFYSIDTRAVPTPAAWLLGWKSAQMLVERYAQDHGNWPRQMAVSAWGTSNMRTGGDDIAQALALIGARPTWDSASRRVTGFEILPLDILDRPRVDVTLRISGFFRDAFPGLIDLFDSAVRAVAELNETEKDNPVATSVRADAERLTQAGVNARDAARKAATRIFGSKPGAYGAGLQALMDERGWQSDADLSKAYVAWGGYAYGNGLDGQAAHGLFETRLKATQAVVQNQDNREHDLLDSDDYYQFEGGMTAAVRHLADNQPAVYHNDHSRPETPKIRTLDEELARVVRARAVNPKWIAGVMRHGYKGAFEIAATVDYLFAFAATAHCVADHHFDAVYEAYVEDETVRNFMAGHNPAALQEMAAKLAEAQDRQLWRPRRNTSYHQLKSLMVSKDGERNT